MMGFQIGDKVIHWSYGLGEIVTIEEKVLRGRETNCYVVRTQDLTIWIPIDNLNQTSLRTPTPPEDFDTLFAILSSPGEALPEDRMLRKDQLRSQMKGGQLASVCRLIRDLVTYKGGAKLNDQEISILELAKKSLLEEWTYSLGVTQSQAQLGLMKLLESQANPPIHTTSAAKRFTKGGDANPSTK